MSSEKTDWTEEELNLFIPIIEETKYFKKNGMKIPLVHQALVKAWRWETLSDEEIAAIKNYAIEDDPKVWHTITSLSKLTLKHYKNFRINGFKGVKQKYVVNGEVNF